MSTPLIPPGYVRVRRGLILPGDLIHRRGDWREAIYEHCMEGASIETLRPDVTIVRPQPTKIALVKVETEIRLAEQELILAIGAYGAHALQTLACGFAHLKTAKELVAELEKAFPQ